MSAVPDTRTAPPRRSSAGMALSLHAALSLLLCLLVAVVWAAAGGGRFWPIWVWFGARDPARDHALAFDAAGVRLTAAKALLVHAQISAVARRILIVTWALAGFGPFWPAWALFGSRSRSGRTDLVNRERLPQARERELAERVDELTRTRRGALDVQAAELRRIERDLHDGAQARLVALSMLMGRAEERLDDRPEVAALVRRAREEASAAIGELRDLARGIAPPVLADRGLRRRSSRSPSARSIPVTVDAHLTAARRRSWRPRRTSSPPRRSRTSPSTAPARAPGRSWTATAALVVDIDRRRAGRRGPCGLRPHGARHRVEALDGELDRHRAGGTTIRAVLPCGS